MREDGWIILRTAGRSTLRLAETLAADGFEVWTPAKTERVRRSRWNVSRNVRKPITPGFAFARAAHLVDLLELAAMRERPRRGRLPAHDGFSVFHYYDRIPIIHDDELEELRLAEKPALVRRKYGRFGNGEEVRVTHGSYEGVVGVVEKCGRDFAVVWLSMFGRQHRAKINTFKLKPITAYSGLETAARKAA